MDFTWFLNILFPPRCLSCNAVIPSTAREKTLCDPCHGSIILFKNYFATTPYYRGAAGSYETPALKALVHALKFRSVAAAGATLGDIVAQYFARLPPVIANPVVIPIPLSRERERERGFNQSLLIAQRFAENTKLPLDASLLSRIRHTKPQSEMKSAAERRRNIQYCFAARKPSAIKDASFILIDDVTTSGATFLEAARVLKASGARAILLLAAARP